jgi:hypothetical protein
MTDCSFEKQAVEGKLDWIFFMAFGIVFLGSIHGFLNAAQRFLTRLDFFHGFRDRVSWVDTRFSECCPEVFLMVLLSLFLFLVFTKRLSVTGVWFCVPFFFSDCYQEDLWCLVLCSPFFFSDCCQEKRFLRIYVKKCYTLTQSRPNLSRSSLPSAINEPHSSASFIAKRESGRTQPRTT